MWYLVKYYDKNNNIVEAVTFDRSEIEGALTPHYINQDDLQELDANGYVKVDTPTRELHIQEGIEEYYDAWEGISYFTIETK